jgi:hypothetical protein
MDLILVFSSTFGFCCRSGAANVFPVIPGSADLIPDWVGANSRFGVLRELAGKRLTGLAISAVKRRRYRDFDENSRYNGNNRDLAPPTASTAP